MSFPFGWDDNRRLIASRAGRCAFPFGWDEGRRG
jgi:hypothetical protein